MCVALAGAQAPRGMQPEDLYALKDVSDAQISPDGSQVVFTVSETSADRSRTVSHLWIVATAGGEPRRMLSGEANESTPRWSPGGKAIAFYSDLDGQQALWVVAANGGEPHRVAKVLRTNFHLTHAGESFTWAPDSRRIAFLSSPENAGATPVAKSGTGPGDILDRLRRPLTREEIEKLPPEVRDRILQAQGTAAANAQPPRRATVPETTASDDPRVITRLQYKSRTAFSDRLQSHIFIADVETGQARQLTQGPYYEHSINWSPKGDEIVFVSNHEPDPDAANNTDLFTVNVANGAVRQPTKTKGCEWTPIFSPDGSVIAYTGTKREVTTIDSVAEDTHLFVIPAQGGEARELDNKLDRRVSMVKWGDESSGPAKNVIFIAGDHGKVSNYSALSIFSENGAPLEVWEAVLLKTSSRDDGKAQLTSFSWRGLFKVAFTESDATHPAELYIESPVPKGDFIDSKLKQLSAANSALLKALQLSQPREFTFKNEGFEVQGWLVPPINLDENKKYPVILSIHGGPHGMHGYAFNPTAQILAARGYAVLLVNPRGSSGYGQKFSDGCVGDWGGGDYRDLMKGVDEALARFKFLDGSRMGVMGGSYGGYMTNWVVTQTDRFKAAVASASLSNLISFYSTSLYQDLVHAEFGGFPWDNYDKLWERSPLAHIKHVRTPLLLIHGEQDNDVHITQAEEMFTALRERGVEAVLVRYPREGHGFREPRHRYDQLVRTLEWFDRHLR